MKAKKIMAVLVSSLLAIGMFAGCGKASEGNSGKSKKNSEGKIDVSYRITCNNGNQRTLINP